MFDMRLDNNQLSGIEAGFADAGDLSKLGRLSLHNNQLSGAIPVELGNLTSLEYLWLHGNQFSGTIPAWLGNLTSLLELSLNGNELSGNIPNLGSLVAMRRLHVECNDLAPTSTGLDWLTSLTPLEADGGLKLHGNRISPSDLPARFARDRDLRRSVRTGGAR